MWHKSVVFGNIMGINNVKMVSDFENYKLPY